MTTSTGGGKRADHVDMRNGFLCKTVGVGGPRKFRVKKVAEKFRGGGGFNSNTIKRNRDIGKICYTSENYY